LTKAEANKALIKLENFIASNDRLVEIQDDQGFEVSVIKTGKYYMNNLQPFTNKKLVQETLDILRTKYSYVFPRKIKFKSSYLHKSNIDRYKSDDVYQVSNKREPVSINREKLLHKINNVLQKNGTKKVSEDKKKIRQRVYDKTQNNYPTLALNLPPLHYTPISKSSKVDKPKHKKELRDFQTAPMTLFRSYMVELMIAAGLIIFLLLIAIFYRSKKNKENRITIQEIYN
jgi:hypothetical protein